MALVINDRVKETTTTTGTGAVALGGAVTGFETFSAGVGNSNTTYYSIAHQTANEWEVGLGTLDGDSSDLTRTTVISSSNSDSAVNFAAGTKDVFCTVPASKLVFEDGSNNVTLNGAITGATNITLSGELDAATLDISGNADIDGTLEADAITVNGITLAETIADTVGAMVTSNTESGITVAYDDADNTLDFTVGTLNQNTTGSAATLTTARTIGGTSFDGSADIAVGLAATATALATARTIHGVSFDGTANIDLSEVISDTVGAMVASNTETGIAVTYDDADNTLDFVIGAGTIVNSMLADDAVGADELAADAVVNASVAAGAAIVDTKLATIATANKVSLTAVDIDGGTDIGADLTTSDLIVVDDGAGGTNRKAALSRVVTLMSAQGFSQEDPTALAIALG
jgi:hypothetical protein